MGKSRYKQIFDDEWFYVPRRGYQQACCDCRLVHVFNFRLRKGKLEMSVRRDARATGQLRRHQKAREANV